MQLSTPIWHLVWSSYGTWLPGDSRSWFKRGEGLKEPSLGLVRYSLRSMKQTPFVLSIDDRRTCLTAIVADARAGGHRLLAANIRSNHVHLLVQSTWSGKALRARFKAISTKALRENGLVQQNRRVWGEGGWQRAMYPGPRAEETFRYVLAGQGVNVEGTYFFEYDGPFEGMKSQDGAEAPGGGDVEGRIGWGPSAARGAMDRSLRSRREVTDRYPAIANDDGRIARCDPAVVSSVVT